MTNNCQYCEKSNCDIPPRHIRPMCMKCWVEHTSEGQQFEKEFYEQQANDDEILRSEDYIDESQESD